VDLSHSITKRIEAFCRDTLRNITIAWTGTEHYTVRSDTKLSLSGDAKRYGASSYLIQTAFEAASVLHINLP
jgi:hypothetical protein